MWTSTDFGGDFAGASLRRGSGGHSCGGTPVKSCTNADVGNPAVTAVALGGGDPKGGGGTGKCAGGRFAGSTSGGRGAGGFFTAKITPGDP